MRRRLLIGLLSGVLVGALLPGVAAADQALIASGTYICTVDDDYREFVDLTGEPVSKLGDVASYLVQSCDRYRVGITLENGATVWVDQNGKIK